MYYLVLVGRDVIFNAEGPRLLIELRMVDGRLVDVPEELVDVLLLGQVLLGGSVIRRLCGLSQAHRRQEQRNRFHPRVFDARRIDRHRGRIGLYTYQASMKEIRTKVTECTIKRPMK